MNRDDPRALQEFPVPAGRPPATGEVAEPVDLPRDRRGRVLLGAGLIIIGLNLRIAVAAIGPILTEIRASTDLSATEVSLLTAIPVFSFGVFAFVTPRLTRRVGMHRLLGMAVATLVAGILLRLHPSSIALFAGTVIVGAAIAVGNVVIPPAIKQDFPDRSGLMMGLYATVLFLGAAVASGAAVPILPVLGGDWRAGLAIWALPAIIAAVIWLPQMRRSPGRLAVDGDVADAPSGRGAPAFRRMFTDPTALAVTGLMGLQSAGYYVMLTWLPTILEDGGMTAGAAGWMLSYSAFPAIAAALVTPAIATSLRPRWLPVVLAAALTGAGYLGLALAPVPAAYLWMTLLGSGQGAAISLSLTYIVWRSPDTEHAGQLSTMAQGLGYLVAGLGPIGTGAVHAATGSWTLPFMVVGVLLLLQTAAGVIASRPTHVGAYPREPVEPTP